MPEQVGRYRILNQLGRGGMGVVHLAEDPLLHRKVAIKMLDLSLEEGSEREFLRDRLLRDARAAAILSHPNIVSIHDVIEEGGAAYVVMEYLAGESLSAYLKQRPRPDTAFTIKVLRAMAAALDYTHGRGIVHRDIKPANVMFDASGTVKILDFGIARLSEARTVTPTGMVMGTVEYMSPEQIKGEPIDGRADQFSLAAVAYQMMTGSTLFGHHTLATLTYKIVNEMPPSAQTRNAALPATVDVVLSKALSKSPDGRFASCSAFVEALDSAFSSRPGAPADRTQLSTQLLIPPAQPVPARPARRSGIIAIVAALAVLVVAAAALMIWKPWARHGIPAAMVTQPPANSSRPESATPPPPTVEKKETPPASTPAEPPANPPQLQSTAPIPPLPEKKPPAKVAKRNPVVDVAPPLPEPKPPSQPEQVEPPKQDTEGTALEAVNRGRDLLKSHNYTAAIQSFTAALSLHPDSAEAYHFRGLAYQRLEQNVAAIKDYSQAIRIRPNGALSYTGRGICLARIHEDDRALEDFNQAIKLRPDNPDVAPAFNGRGVIFLRRGQYNSALHDFNMATRLSPQYEIAYRNRGRVKQALGDQPGAAADFKKANEMRDGASSPGNEQ